MLQSDIETPNTNSIARCIEPDTYEFEKMKVEVFKDYLDSRIGYWWWKYYTTTAFWSNFSTPINFTITLLSAVTTGQVATDTYVDSNTFMIINIVTLTLTAINSFFRPLEQYKQSSDYLKGWYEIGNEFEDVFLTKYDSNLIKCAKYKEIKDKMNRLVLDQEKNRNFIIDLVYMLIECWLHKKNKNTNWLNTYRKIIDQTKNTTLYDNSNTNTRTTSNSNQPDSLDMVRSVISVQPPPLYITPPNSRPSTPPPPPTLLPMRV